MCMRKCFMGEIKGEKVVWVKLQIGLSGRLKI